MRDLFRDGFRAEDFKGWVDRSSRNEIGTVSEWIANRANVLFRQAINEAPIVFSGAVESEEWDRREHPGGLDTHQARLICVEEKLK